MSCFLGYVTYQWYKNISSWYNNGYVMFLLLYNGLRRLFFIYLFIFFFRSTNLDSWSPEQLKMMVYGGNCRAQVFFKQHGWSQGGKTESKYTSRAADLYKQNLAKEVAAKSKPEELPPVSTTQVLNNELSSIKTGEASSKESTTTVSPRVSCSVKKPVGAKRTAKTGGLGARKLTTKVNN